MKTGAASETIWRRARRGQGHVRRAARRQYTPAIRVLVLCTANICRSPMAEALLRRELGARGITAGVRSAGRLPGGRAMTPEGLEVMRDRGLDLGSHRSQEAIPALVGDADLVLGMAREHVRDAATLVSDVVPRAFTLKELVRRGESIGPRPASEPVSEWLGRAVATRRGADLLGSSPDDDVHDPIGEPLGRYRAVAAEIADHVERLVNVVWPKGAAGASEHGTDTETGAR